MHLMLARSGHFAISAAMFAKDATLSGVSTGSGTGLLAARRLHILSSIFHLVLRRSPPVAVLRCPTLLTYSRHRQNVPHAAKKITGAKVGRTLPVNATIAPLVAHQARHVRNARQHGLIIKVGSTTVRGNPETPATGVGKTLLYLRRVLGQEHHGVLRIQMRQKPIEAIRPESAVPAPLGHVVDRKQDVLAAEQRCEVCGPGQGLERIVRHLCRVFPLPAQCSQLSGMGLSLFFKLLNFGVQRRKSARFNCLRGTSLERGASIQKSPDYATAMTALCAVGKSECRAASLNPECSSICWYSAKV